MTGEQIRAVDAAFSRRLHETRLAMRMSRARLAARSGVPAWAIERIEIGKSLPGGGRTPRRRPTVGEAVALAQGLGVQVAHLLGGAR